MENLSLIKKLDEYEIYSNTDYFNALRETIQNYILSSLSKQNFFDYAAFYGGTCLRIFRGLNRFSEDLDFVSIKKLDKKFEIYIKEVVCYLTSLGFSAEYKITDLKDKKITTEVVTAYIKIDLNKVREIVNEKYQYKFTYGHPLFVKVDLSTDPIKSSIDECVELKFPEKRKVRVLNYPTMFAGKLCAILRRHYRFRVKGRDYYDYMHYVNHKIPINLDYINEKCNTNFTFETFKNELKNKFETVDFNKICYDLKPFVKSNYNLDNLKNDNLLTTINKLILYK